MSNQNEEVIHKLYTAFAQYDADAMSACYHKDIVFEDPAFGRLHGEDVMHMWRMLITRAKPNIDISHSHVRADELSGEAKWEAIYPFSMTGREVHNKITASFKFQDGRIIEHIDKFDLHKWSAMAFGWKGKLFGGMSFFKKKIHSTALGNLKKWKEKHS